MEVVSSQGEPRYSRGETAGEKAFLPHVRSRGARGGKKGRNGKTGSEDGAGEGAKLTRSGELSGREERKREDERASSISPTW